MVRRPNFPEARVLQHGRRTRYTAKGSVCICVAQPGRWVLPVDELRSGDPASHVGPTPGRRQGRGEGLLGSLRARRGHPDGLLYPRHDCDPVGRRRVHHPPRRTVPRSVPPREPPSPPHLLVVCSHGGHSQMDELGVVPQTFCIEW